MAKDYSTTAGNPIDWMDEESKQIELPTISTYGIGVLLGGEELEPGEEVLVYLNTKEVTAYFVAERNGMCWVIANNEEDSPGWYVRRTNVVPTKRIPNDIEYYRFK